MRNIKSQIVVFYADFVLKFSTEIYIFIKHPQNWDFLYFSIDSFVHGINRKIFRAPQGNLSLKTLILVGLITKR